jgi:hypothetical protein
MPPPPLTGCAPKSLSLQRMCMRQRTRCGCLVHALCCAVPDSLGSVGSTRVQLRSDIFATPFRLVGSVRTFCGRCSSCSKLNVRTRYVAQWRIQNSLTHGALCTCAIPTVARECSAVGVLPRVAFAANAANGQKSSDALETLQAGLELVKAANINRATLVFDVPVTLCSTGVHLAAPPVTCPNVRTQQREPIRRHMPAVALLPLRVGFTPNTASALLLHLRLAAAASVSSSLRAA